MTTHGRGAGRLPLLLALLGAAALSIGKIEEAIAAEALPNLGIDLSKTSVSGLSSGAYMAGQIEVAHAKDVVGAGLVAGGPYGCAETASSELFPYWPVVLWQNATQAANRCMKVDWGAPDGAKLAERAKALAARDKIDSPDALAGHKVYLFSGNDDRTVARAVVEAAKRFYQAAGVPEANIDLVEHPGGHAFLTETQGTACGLSQAPFISDCDYDQAGAILAWIYGNPLAAPATAPTGKFVTFDQNAFNGGSANGLAAEGVVYVPAECETHPGCRLHIALHGCDQARETVGNAFIEKTGLANYADTNRLTILFPQIAGSVVNPHGCWDWWGYSDIDYLERDAPQIAAIWAMARRLAEKP